MKPCLGVVSIALLAIGCRADPDTRPAPQASKTPAEWERRDRPVEQADLQILLRAKAILTSPAVWDRNDDRRCEKDDTKWSLFCALQKASYEVLGEYQHRRVALQEVRFAIGEVSQGRRFGHRLMEFNNTAAFEDVHRVLQMALDRVTARLGGN